ncbi:MAG: cobalamin-binding protein [Burkholderiaceae bacterium]
MKRSVPRLAQRACAILLVMASMTAAALGVVDDRGVRIELAAPARRIVTLAPHLTELMFAAGAGERIVGTVAYSDFPAAAQRIERVGDASALDLERLVALKPDLVVVWLGGTPQRQLDVLAALGLPLYYQQPSSLGSIADSLERFGALAGTSALARPAAVRFRERLAGIAARYRGSAPVTVFHQVWDRPVMTVGGNHLISQVIALCGGRNIFDGLSALAPVVSTEAVLDADPELIGGAGAGTGLPRDAGLGIWLAWPQLRAVSRGNLYVLPPDLISQAGPRILDGAQQLCDAMDEARRRRP